MKGFNFEKNLSHQSQAVKSTVKVFENMQIERASGVNQNYINPEFDFMSSMEYARNIEQIQQSNGITEILRFNSNILDIMMETGTGKTYTYTKTIFELNKHYGIFKFIIVVPTLSIKAGTLDFLKSASCREHFREQYNKTLNLHVVESQKNNKRKKAYMPSAITNFVQAGNFERNNIQVMLINAGMINSETMQTSFHKSLLDKHSIPFNAIKSTLPFVIIDEPHKFGKDNKTWGNIKKMQAQFILRYGATFNGYENLIYNLTSIDSFNKNLVKGVIGHITEFENGKNSIVKFIDSDGTEASFELTENNKHKTIKLTKQESLAKVHLEMTNLIVENLNKSTVVLSNGLEMKKGDKLNPFSYAETLQETMIKKAVKHHFEIERNLLTRDVRIKPITLFFIDNIDEYRNKEGYIRKTLEECIRIEIQELLKTEGDTAYKAYLKKTLLDLPGTHAGYFSKDNQEKDASIEKELNEILHDKQALLDLQNIRRFIFSKWTLREGWDNPNVFQICKLRSSGSEISKLQEVGRGLRLPVNEYGNRVKDEQFYLNYFVDFTESDFIDKLVNEINQKSGAISSEEVPDKLSEAMIKRICEVYRTSEDKLLELLDSNNVITRSNSFKTGGFDFIKDRYSLIFTNINPNKIIKASDPKKKIAVRVEKYQELKDLWEKLNEKVILEYKIDKESSFKKLFTNFLREQKNSFRFNALNERVAKVEIIDDRAITEYSESVYGIETMSISTMKYSDFLLELAKALSINIKTLHQAFIDTDIDINRYLSQGTLRMLKERFDNYLMANAIDKFSIEYKKISNTIHPTKLTDSSGNVLEEISSSDAGIQFSGEGVAKNYLLEELYYDSDLEKINIKTEIQEVTIFTKIPKNSIKIPVAGGRTYSPDFAYVVRFKDGQQKLHFIVEAKNVTSENELREEEKSKIRHAEKFFGDSVKIKFKTQFSNDKIADLIKKCYMD
ncbi:MAG: type III restriction-modification system endonuclease [bacterium]